MCYIIPLPQEKLRLGRIFVSGPTYVGRGTVAALMQNSLTMPFPGHFGFFHSCVTVFGVLGAWVMVFCVWLGGDFGVRPGVGHLTAVYVVY